MKEDRYSLSEYDYSLPKELIAQEPLSSREQARLLIIDRKKAGVESGFFYEIGRFFQKGDVIVLNDTKVINARIFAHRETGARVEVFLVSEREPGVWEVMLKPGKRIKDGEKIRFDGKFIAEVLNYTAYGIRLLRFYPGDIKELIDKCGEVPLPPYIKKPVQTPEQYQTVFAQKEGAIAAPTAGFHFTPELIAEMEETGVRVVKITLHCGLSTFRPVKAGDIREHLMTKEKFVLSGETAGIINRAKGEGRRIIAVGTTVTRTLETCAEKKTRGVEVIPRSGETSLYIYPGYEFKVVDHLITNFHTPCSSNLILVSSFCGHSLMKKAYFYAINRGFRFFSFGDGTLVL